jgi:hypothetical protein
MPENHKMRGAPACAEIEGLTIFCCLLAVSADRSGVLSVQQAAFL